MFGFVSRSKFCRKQFSPPWLINPFSYSSRSGKIGLVPDLLVGLKGAIRYSEHLVVENGEKKQRSARSILVVDAIG